MSGLIGGPCPKCGEQGFWNCCGSEADPAASVAAAVEAEANKFVIETAEMLSAVIAFQQAKELANKLVRQAFPLCHPVRVEFSGGHSEIGVIHAYVADSPDQIAVMFSNGNVSDKPVHRLTLVKK